MKKILSYLVSIAIVLFVIWCIFNIGTVLYAIIDFFGFILSMSFKTVVVIIIIICLIGFVVKILK